MENAPRVPPMILKASRRAVQQPPMFLNQETGAVRLAPDSKAVNAGPSRHKDLSRPRAGPISGTARIIGTVASIITAGFSVAAVRNRTRFCRSEGVWKKALRWDS